jgi:hypothetical protein
MGDAIAPEVSMVRIPFASSRPFVLVALVAVGLSLGGTVPVLAADGVEVSTGQGYVDELGKQLKSRQSQNADINATLDLVLQAYLNPVKPEGVEDKKFAEDVKKFRKDAEKALVKALDETQINKTAGTNEREDVNIKAAEVIGAIGASKVEGLEDNKENLAKDVQKFTKTLEKRAKDDIMVSGTLWESVFAALGKLNQRDSLVWMLEEHVHTNSSPTYKVDQLSASLKAMILFTEVPGKLRYDIVDKVKTSFSSVETQAAQTTNDAKVQAQKQFWDRIKTDVVKVLQYYAAQPTNADGAALATVAEFVDWWRDNDKPKKEPWVDAKIVGE